MPTHPDMTTDTNDDRTVGEAPVPTAPPAESDAAPDPETDPGTDADAHGTDVLGDGDAVLQAIQHQVAVFGRRAEQTRLGGIGQARNSMDRAAYLLLNRLDKQGAMGVKALAASMGIDSSTVTRQVAPLVDAGMVKRTTHPEDGRAVVLSLTSRGRSRLEQVRSSRRELMAMLTDDWSEEERDAFCSLLTRFNSALLGVQPLTGPETPA